MKVIAVHALIIFSEKIGIGHSITCNKFFSILKKNHFYLNCTWRVLQIFIGNSYPTDGQLLCATVNLQNATQVIIFDLIFKVFSPCACMGY